MMSTGKLDVRAQGECEIVMTREFNAPRRLVWDAWTKPELIRRWLGEGFEGWTFAVCEVDLRVGGAYRFQWKGPGGEEMGMRGEYREIAAPERLVSTEVFDESWYPGEAIDTMVLTEANGRTTCELTVLYASQEVRDGVLSSEAAGGLAANYDALDGVLATLV